MKDLAGKPDAADGSRRCRWTAGAASIDTLATVTIHRQAKAGGRFDPRRSPSTGS